jgi:hypothetical protein
MAAVEKSPDRKKRIFDALALRKPDSVPLFIPFGMFPARYAGITFQEALEDPDKWFAALEKAHIDFAPDMCSLHAFEAISNSILDSRVYQWPGHGVGPTSSPQYVEGEYIKPEEYDAFLKDPSDFILREFLPRAYSKLKGFQTLPPIMSFIYTYQDLASMFNEEVVDSLKALIKASEYARDYQRKLAAVGARLSARGFHEVEGSISFTPFDIISDYMRGLKGSTLDMFRYPEKLMEVKRKLLPVVIDYAVAGSRISGKTFVVIPLHRGSDEFMSLKQFETFYWPDLHELLLSLINAGLTPMPFFEGIWDKRLEYLQQLPKGKVFGWFDRTDLFRAKSIIGDTMCLVGGMPVSLLQSGTPDQVKIHTKKLIDVLGKNGGFVMGSYSVIEDAKPELVRVWTDATREYGKY